MKFLHPPLEGEGGCGIGSASPRAKGFLSQNWRRSWRVVLPLALAERHDRAAHHRRTKSDHEAEEKQPERDAGRAVGEDQVTQAAGVKPEQSADQQDRQRQAACEIDREQPEQRVTNQVWAAKRACHVVKSNIAG